MNPESRDNKSGDDTTHSKSYRSCRRLVAVGYEYPNVLVKSEFEVIFLGIHPLFFIERSGHYHYLTELKAANLYLIKVC